MLLRWQSHLLGVSPLRASAPADTSLPAGHPGAERRKEAEEQGPAFCSGPRGAERIRLGRGGAAAKAGEVEAGGEGHGGGHRGVAEGQCASKAAAAAARRSRGDGLCTSLGVSPRSPGAGAPRRAAALVRPRRVSAGAGRQAAPRPGLQREAPRGRGRGCSTELGGPRVPRLRLLLGPGRDAAPCRRTPRRRGVRPLRPRGSALPGSLGAHGGQRRGWRGSGVERRRGAAAGGPRRARRRGGPGPPRAAVHC